MQTGAVVDYETIWRTALGELEVAISKPSFITWFRDTCILAIDEPLITVGVPTNFTLEWLSDKYRFQILEVLKKLLPEYSLKEVSFKIAQPSQGLKPVRLDQPISVEPPTTSATEQATQPDLASAAVDDGHLNPAYVFDSFIAGTNSRLAHAASLAVASEPGKRHNPLFIYGGVGLGKTHLVHAIGNDIAARFPKKRILYASCERFANEFIHAIQTKRMEAFKERYRTVDVLLIDDIQFLSGKEGTQEEFFHTFNALHQTNRQIVLTSDRMPQAIPELEDRLSSRFVWGMVTDIKSPDVETRAAILQQKCLDRKTSLPEEVVALLARTFQNNIRELEGGLNQVLAYCELEKVEPTLAVIERLLREQQPLRQTAISIGQVLTVVGNYYQIDQVDLLGPRRNKEFVHPRQIIMYLLRYELGFSFPKIGRELNKDHTTIMHGVEKLKRELPKDSLLQHEITTLKDHLYNSTLT
ncbi:MAG: chromosomal replication initiator protein DnaA [Patescibacteria group bacterium]